MSRFLNGLQPEFRVIAFELIARCAEQGIAVMIIDTLRTQAEQEEYIKIGTSWTKNSKHLPHGPDGLSYAIDIAPYDVYQLYGHDKLKWNAADPVWQRIGKIGKDLGLLWGGDWKQKDMGHFEYAFNTKYDERIT